jgi:hypothetical protein
MNYGSPGIPLVAPPAVGIPPVPFRQPTNLFRYGEQSLWSTQLLASGTAVASSTFRLFATPLGQQGQGFAAALTIAETSLKTGGMIPAGVAFDTFGISCHFSHGGTGTTPTLNVPADTDAQIGNILNIQNNAVLTWDFTQTQVDIAPVSLVGAGGGVFGSVSQNAAGASVGHMNNGAGQVWMYRKHAVSLPGQSVFSLLLRFGARAAAMNANNGVAVRTSLLGFYKNAIEIG